MQGEVLSMMNKTRVDKISNFAYLMLVCFTPFAPIIYFSLALAEDYQIKTVVDMYALKAVSEVSNEKIMVKHWDKFLF